MKIDFLKQCKDNVVKFKLAGRGLQPIELTAIPYEDTDIFTITNLTDEIWEELKTGNYYIKLSISDGEQIYKFNNYFVTVEESDDAEMLLGLPGIEVPGSIVIINQKVKDDTTPLQNILIFRKDGLIVNPIGEFTSGYIMHYLGEEDLLDISNVAFNGAWRVGSHTPYASEWVDNKLTLSIESVASNLYEGRTFLSLGNNSDGICLLLKLTINNVDYTLVNQSNTTSSLIILNDDLSTTVISCKSTFESSSLEFNLEFKAVKDKTDITETFKEELTTIQFYAL